MLSYTLTLLLFLLPQSVPASATLPALQFEAPAELSAIRNRLQAVESARLADVMQLTGNTEGGLPIRVILAPESSQVARFTPGWIAGFTEYGSDVVVIFPSRSPSYPHSSLEDVLRHEVAHVLIARSAVRQSVPRWFNEGLAMAAERERRFQDQTQLLYQLVSGEQTSLFALDRLFSGGREEQARAYALAGAIVDKLRELRGPDVCARILVRMGGGASFESAFREITGETPDRMEAVFWQSQRLWTTWIPIIGSSTTLWLAVTLLAILAIFAKRRRNKEFEEKWAREDAFFEPLEQPEEDPPDEPTRPN